MQYRGRDVLEEGHALNSAGEKQFGALQTAGEQRNSGTAGRVIVRPSVPIGGAVEAEVGEASGKRPMRLEAAAQGNALVDPLAPPRGGPGGSVLKGLVPPGGEPGGQLLCLLRVRAAAAAPAPGLLSRHQQHSHTPPGAAAEVGAAASTRWGRASGGAATSQLWLLNQVSGQAAALPAFL